ncbi:MAG: hypothetical protein WDZ26_07065 [Nitriliruptoraceae bacterium]
MSEVQVRLVDDDDVGLWGYCPSCERWWLSAAWGAVDTPDAAANVVARCPACDTVSFPIEVRVDGITRLRLELDLPPGAEFPILP